MRRVWCTGGSRRPQRNAHDARRSSKRVARGPVRASAGAGPVQENPPKRKPYAATAHRAIPATESIWEALSSSGSGGAWVG
eukprot:scaffold112413_cov63-Phaeocystis_antarctica.AAC.3